MHSFPNFCVDNLPCDFVTYFPIKWAAANMDVTEEVAIVVK